VSSASLICENLVFILIPHYKVFLNFDIKLIDRNINVSFLVSIYLATTFLLSNRNSVRVGDYPEIALRRWFSCFEEQSIEVDPSVFSSYPRISLQETMSFLSANGLEWDLWIKAKPKIVGLLYYSV
jgi:hypothetical protein